MAAGVDISGLLQPIDVGGVRLRNRFVMPGMQRGMCVEGRLLPEMADYYRRRVDGGVGLVVGEGCSVEHPSSIWESRFPRLNEGTLDGWERCVRAVHGAGGRMLVQISHPGALRAESQNMPGLQVPALSASGLYKAGKPNGRAATLQELAEIRDAFARAAWFARKAGADGIELHACHGMFLDEFFWAETNLRDDRYGGAHIRDRARYPAEVASAVREAVGPDFLVALRFSQWKEADYYARIVETPDELEALLAVMREAGVDLFHPSTRHFDRPEWPGSDLTLAGWTKQLTDVPVIAVGSVGLSHDVMDSLAGAAETRFVGEPSLRELVRRFDNGEFDLIAIGRSLISDSAWVRKVAAGRYGEVRQFSREDLGVALDMEPDFILEIQQAQAN